MSDPLPSKATSTDAATLRDADVREHKDLAAFSYVWVMSFVVFFAKKNSAFARHHSRQGIVLCAMTIVWFVPFVGHLLTLLIVLGMLYGFINASQGQWTDVPLAGRLARGEWSWGVGRSIVEKLRGALHHPSKNVTKSPDEKKTSA